MERIFRRGLVVFRWGAWIWIAISVIVYWDSDYLRHKGLAIVMLALALAFTVVQTALVPISIRFANRRRVAVTELSIGFAFMALDGYVRRAGVAFDAAPSLGGWWPLVGLLSFATYAPLWISAFAGLMFGAARLLSVNLNDISFADMTGSNWLSVLSTGLFAALAAISVNYLMRALRSAESEVALARAREDVARTLHDGVLQTLAVVERRVDDPSLRQLARDQERELRSFLFGGVGTATAQQTLGEGLLKAAGRFENAFGGRATVIVAEDVPDVDATTLDAILGAAGEAMMNAGKHGQASAVNIYVEPDDEGGVFCSVKDDGVGFDPAVQTNGTGIRNSIEARIKAVGGRVEVRSTPGNGSEVMLWVP
jgi:signal transduction histidine kinase